MKARLFDSSIVSTAQEALDFIANILESSTEYSVIGKDLDGKILLWNEGARRMYGYDADEIVGKLNSEVLHTREDVAAGKPREMMQAALQNGKWEGVIGRIRKDGRRIYSARYSHAANGWLRGGPQAARRPAVLEVTNRGCDGAGHGRRSRANPCFWLQRLYRQTHRSRNVPVAG
ncbi:MAG: hypothetical protein DMG32_05630 [Acidobacteria bacterium]|nr:MAG: hypothetical protein DMG32_05630 [Acidobacteriota bacterium]